MNNDNGGLRAAVLHCKDGSSEVEGEAPLAGLLGLVHGAVGPVQQIVDVTILARVTERTANAAGEGQQVAGHVGTGTAMAASNRSHRAGSSSSGWRRAGSMMVNSSPAKRATMSPGRTSALSTLAKRCSRASPT